MFVVEKKSRKLSRTRLGTKHGDDLLLEIELNGGTTNVNDVRAGHGLEGRRGGLAVDLHAVGDAPI